MKKVRFILAGFLLFGMTAVMAQQNDSEKDAKKSDQYSTEQSKDTTGIQQQQPSDGITSPAPESKPDGSNNTLPADTTSTTPPERKETGEPMPETPSK